MVCSAQSTDGLPFCLDGASSVYSKMVNAGCSLNFRRGKIAQGINTSLEFRLSVSDGGINIYLEKRKVAFPSSSSLPTISFQMFSIVLLRTVRSYSVCLIRDFRVSSTLAIGSFSCCSA